MLTVDSRNHGACGGSRVFTSAAELADTVTRENHIGPHFLLGVDGVDGAGKSRLAIELAARLKARVVHLDDFLERGQGLYVAALRLREIWGTLEPESGPMIVEGVCLLAALERIGVTATRLVYVKRMSPAGHWADEVCCEVPEGAEAAIEARRAELAEFEAVFEALRGAEPGYSDAAYGPAKAPDLPELVQEVIRYHARYRPHRRADYVLERAGL